MKKKTISQLHKLVWIEIRRLYKDKGNKCYTCGKFCEGSGRHVGHSIPKASLSLEYKYDPRGLRIQCYNCNINLGGNQHIFIGKLEKEPEGLAFLNEACRNVDGLWYSRRSDISLNSQGYLEKLLEKLKAQ